MLWMALITMSVPSLVNLGFTDEQAAQAPELVSQLSMTAAVILLMLYGLSLLFSMKTHRFLLMPAETELHEPEWSKRTAAAVLLGATIAVAFLSEVFVHSIETVIADGAIQMSEMFIGVIVVAVVGNAAEGLVAVWVARENKMELSFQIAMGSCLQVALMVAPVLVIASWAMGELMPLTFGPFELMSLAAAILIASSALNDGKSNWLEGMMFLAVYVFFAIVFWCHP
jgi:Ca2+:H+ antiporter